MNWQQILTFGIVGAAALYLASYIWRMVRAFWKEGSVCRVCEGCALAKLKLAADKKQKQAGLNHPDGVIPISTIRTHSRSVKREDG
ncbi:MAG TPA: hypothetical protein VKV29_08480 [Chthonomonas sp.]|jgi:hypothetical protein|uniref:hypothetical protein n=1 Tax=Chthonomonas sp. TaxID=2282153 RepID=UPI002B4B4BBC|nr:hypothetical protein [Chthonomonas sp.]HLH80302.1 hypothetical protein [Chthonomonas sp.]